MIFSEGQESPPSSGSGVIVIFATGQLDCCGAPSSLKEVSKAIDFLKLIFSSHP